MKGVPRWRACRFAESSFRGPVGFCFGWTVLPGAGLTLRWVALFALTVPIWTAFLARIRREEAALLEGLGASYAAYCPRTKRLLPGIY
jgi:protein-S-isoprenylcysteine O-methyltransferase Ste14